MATKSKKKDPIHIKKSHEGRFTQWCHEHGFHGVTQECIEKAKAQGGHAAEMANFAANAKHFHHGGD